MPHVLKKYISNRGSALFMVLSTMTALLISSMAMYFSMVSSRASQYAVFNHTQANQSAQSIATIINKALTSAGNLSAPDPKGKALLDKIMSLTTVGESITTTADNFSSLDPTNSSATNPDVPDLGAYAVIITLTKYDPATEERVFDIAVLSSVDGNREIVHLEYGYSSSIENQGSPGESELFVATGYVPNDAYIDGGFFLTNTFFDTEFTYVGQYDSKANFLSGNLSTGGSLIFSSYMQPIVNEDRMAFLAKPTTWSIRGDFEQNGSNQVQLMAGSKIMIGGDAYFNAATVNSILGKNSAGGKIDLYILGDFNMKANQQFDNVNVYVNGDFNYPAGLYINFNNLYVNGNVNFGDTSEWGARPNIKGTRVATPDAMPKWDWTGPDARGMSVAEVSEELGRRTSTNTYGKWEIQDTLVKDEDGKRIQVQLNSSNTFQNGVEGMKTVYTIALAGSESAKPEGVNGWTADCVLGTYTNAATAVVGGATIDGFQGKVNGGNPLAIILDTGDNPDNIMALRLKPYIDMDSDGTAETFAWIGKDGISNNNPFTILVKGRGSVILDVAADATYQESNFQQCMHYSWFRILGGTEDTLTGSRMDSTGSWSEFSSYVYNSSPINGGVMVDGKKPDALAASLIHDNCRGGDGCSYTTATSTNKCSVCNKEFVDITCSEHGKVNSYCPDCQEYIADKLAKFGSGGEGFCSCRVDEDKVDTFLNSHNDVKTAISDATGVIYPNVNIYLVSISEGSDLRFATDVNNNAIMQNSFYGYIYAPYVTYKAIGSSGSGCPRFIGGLLVSDYVINDNYAFLACYPDKMPDEMASIGGGVMQGNLNSKTTKSWKTTIGGYH